MATEQNTTATSPELNRPLRTEAEARAEQARPDLNDIRIDIGNAILDLDQFENALIYLTNVKHEDEWLKGLFDLLADSLGHYLVELRQGYNRLQAAAKEGGAS